jgi:phospholipid N-methyltransferase
VTTALFLRDVVKRPLEMGAILPSSRHLAAAMVDAARVRRGDTVLELGAGSGSFTAELARRHPRSPLVLVEPGVELAAGLSQRFPTARVCAVRAQDLSTLGLARGSVHRVVSGLPWALWSTDVQNEILEVLSPLLSTDARLVTFHYVHSRALGRVAAFRHLLCRRFAKVEHSAPVWRNVPPAYVHIAEGPRG